MKLKTVFILLFLLIVSAGKIFCEEPAAGSNGSESSQAENSSRKLFDFNFGIFPTTMGTHGEYLAFSFMPLDFLSLSVTGSHDKVYQGGMDFEKTGADIHGSIEKDILFADGFIGARISFGVLSLGVKAGGSISSTKSLSTGRIIDASMGYIDDTFGMIDINSDELYFGPAAGGDILIDLSFLSLTISGSYMPVLFGDISSSYFQNFPRFDSSGNLIYNWRRNTEDLSSIKGFEFDTGCEVGLRLEKVITVSVFGNFSLVSYSALSAVKNDMLTFYQTLPNPPVAVPYSNQLTGTTNVTDMKLEAGVSCSLDFVEELFKFSSRPVLGVSYVKVSRDELHNYFELGKEKWIDDYGYVKFTILWRI